MFFRMQIYFNTHLHTLKLKSMAIEKKFVIATETVDGIVKGRKYELIESEDMDHYIIDESGEVTCYYYKSLRDIEDTD